MANSTNILTQLVVGQAQPAVTANENFAAMSPAATLGRIESACALLTWAYYGGPYRGLDLSSGTLTLTASQANLYLVVKKSDGVHSFSTATTNWNNLTDYDRVYRVTTSGTAATVWEDKRGFFGGSAGSGAVASDVIWDAKGDIAVATAADTAARLAVGTNGQVLTADSGETTGTKWATPSTGNVATDVIWDTKGDLAVATGANTASKLVVGTNGQVLTADSAQTTGAAWTTLTTVATDLLFDAKGDLPVGTGSNTSSKLVVGTNGQVLTADSGEATGTKWATPAAAGSVATDVIYDAKGDLPVGTGSDTAARLAVGTNGQVFTADSTQTTGTKWATPASGVTAFTGLSDVPSSYSGQGSKSVRVNSGATALEFFTPAGSGSVATDVIFDAKGDLPVGTGADASARRAVGTNGQVLTADSAETTGVKWATPSAGAGATFTESSSAPGSPVSGDRWHDIDVGIMYTYSGNQTAWVEF